MKNVDEVTVKALELKAPRASTKDADELRGQVLGGVFFSSFNQQDRMGIWARLQAVEGLIPSLYAFFEDVNYLKALVDCVIRLVTPSARDTVSTALLHAYSDADQDTGRAVLQLTESSFASCPANPAQRANLGVRQLYAYAMRHYLQMPRERRKKDLIARHTTNADPTILREFADLAERLGFKSPEITALKQCSNIMVARSPSMDVKPRLVTDGNGLKKKDGCGLPNMEEYMEDCKSLFVKHLHDLDEEQGERVTSFFVRKSIYTVFFGKPSPLPIEDLLLSDSVVSERQERETLEQERLEQERRDQGRQGQEEKERLRTRRTQTREDHHKRLQRLKEKKMLSERLLGKGQDSEPWTASENPSLEDERRLEDQQRID